MVTGADQVCPVVLELTCGPAPVTAICALGAFSAKLPLPTAAGSVMGADQALAAGGHRRTRSRSRASPPRVRACVADQSYDVGSHPNCRSQSRIALSSASGVQRCAIAPGWQALQYA